METNKLKKPSLRFICQIVIIVCGGLGLIGMDSQNKLDILIVEILGSFVGCLLLYLYFKIPFCTVLVNLSLEPLSHAVLRNSNLDI